jgi:hypothetical protein
MTCGMIARTAIALAVFATWSQPVSADSFRNFGGNCRPQGNLSTPSDRTCVAGIAIDVSPGGGGFCVRPTDSSARPVFKIALSRIRSAPAQICVRKASIVATERARQALR